LSERPELLQAAYDIRSNRYHFRKSEYGASRRNGHVDVEFNKCNQLHRYLWQFRSD